MRWLLALALVACDEPCERLVGPSGFSVCIERAETAAERTRGLVGAELRPGEGLLLVFPVAGELCLTNAGVSLDLDAFWLDGGGLVVASRRLEARAEGPFCNEGRFVLEVRAGAELAVGQRLRGL